ncbi:hypothetical protein FO519_003258 [Halicephalobus sp. NKZ332]|nr:hypothetical protein FO519_003258 [Halicephalobus sp. NKZ332]
MLRKTVGFKLLGQVRHVSPSLAPLPQEDPFPATPPSPFKKPSRIAPIPSRVPVELVLRRTAADEWRTMGPDGRLKAYLQLSKHRLTLLITSTAVGGFMMSSAPFSLSTLAACTAGTALLSSAANACNQLLEAPYDAQMKRTQSRVLVVHQFSPLQAFMFANLTGLAGTSLLYFGCNSWTAALGILNLVLYAGVYTPMKRYHVGCTWAGAVVGAIPPLMGYTALTGGLDPGAFVLAAILYAWQFPHFNGLSWNLRGDYSRAGYRVMCVTDEGLCRRTTLRYSMLLFGLCSIAAPLSCLTTPVFAANSVPLNAVMMYLSYKFYRDPGAQTSRNLFRFSLLYLPLIMALMVISRGEPKKPAVSQKPVPIAED